MKRLPFYGKFTTCWFPLVLIFLTPQGAAGQKITEIIYKQVDTTLLKMEIYHPDTPAGDKLRPAIIFFFGGGWNRGSRDQFRPFAEHYAAKSMVAVLADYRIRSKHGTSPVEALKDAKSAIRYLRSHAKSLGVDSDCIIGSGGSAGGHLAAACYTNDNINEDNDPAGISAKPNALVLFNPVIDNGREGYGYDRISEHFPEFSPLHSIRGTFPPTIFFLGTKDRLIPVSTAELFKQKIEAAGGRCDLFLFEDQAHGFFNKAEYRAKTIPLTDTFLMSLPCVTLKD